MKIKVCGMREPDNIRSVEALGIDLMGFIFWPGSSRYVSHRPDYLPTGCKRVGVFVDAPIEDVRRHIREYALDAVQLHGHESPDYLQQLQGVSIIKALSIATADDCQSASQYEGLADALLFDTKARLVGGNGTKFDWTLLDTYHGTTPFLLSGGICPDDAERISRFRHPRCIGIDLNSRFESKPALKDAGQLATFIKKIRHYEQQD